MTDHPTPITAEELAQWREIEKAATAGPWDSYHDDFECLVGIPRDPNWIQYQCIAELSGGIESGERQEQRACNDSDFIAHARNTYARLLDEVERLQSRQRKAVSIALRIAAMSPCPFCNRKDPPLSMHSPGCPMVEIVNMSNWEALDG